MARRLLCVTLAALALAACGDNGGTVDSGAPQRDAGPDATTAAPTVLYLAFDGATLTKGTDDPVADVSLLIRPGGATVPPWRAAAPDRAARVAAVAAGVTAVLAPYNVDVVTTRPAAGPYDMVVFGGESLALFGAPGIVSFGGQRCDAIPHISFVLELAIDDADAASRAVGMVASNHFVPTTTTAGHCTCPGCEASAGALCVIGGDLPLADPGCPPDGAYPATFDEHAWFLERLGAHR